MTVASVVGRRGITEVLHFTQSKGLLGTLAAGAVLSRTHITDKSEEILAYIAKVNATRVIDPGYEGYVNLSVSEINSEFFGVSSKWYPEADWAILAFDPLVLSHAGVVFCTTNNAYPRCQRATGDAGLEALFANSVNGKYTSVHTRPKGFPENLTTDEQAEVLYPKRLSTKHLLRVYARDSEFADQIHAHFGLIGHRAVEVIVAPERFLSRGGATT